MLYPIKKKQTKKRYSYINLCTQKHSLILQKVEIRIGHLLNQDAVNN
uniref:Uncharacterized protein n=1 Tax=Lepeophtheirus salmonis TaxID=72036 RepID=A0A0K2TN29_LEPSM